MTVKSTEFIQPGLTELRQEELLVKECLKRRNKDHLDISYPNHQLPTPKFKPSCSVIEGTPKFDQSLSKTPDSEKKESTIFIELSYQFRN